MVFAVCLSSAFAHKTKMVTPLRIKTKYIPFPLLKPKAQLTTPYLDVQYSNSYYSDIYGQHFESPLSYSAVTTGGTTVITQSKTDSYGNTINITWSVTGNTLNWSVNAVPGADINTHIQCFLVFERGLTNYVESDYEDPTGEGYGNMTWSDSGSVDLTGLSNPLEFSFEYYTTHTPTNTYVVTTCSGYFYF